MYYVKNYPISMVRCSFATASTETPDIAPGGPAFRCCSREREEAVGLCRRHLPGPLGASFLWKSPARPRFRPRVDHGSAGFQSFRSLFTVFQSYCSLRPKMRDMWVTKLFKVVIGLKSISTRTVDFQRQTTVFQLTTPWL